MRCDALFPGHHVTFSSVVDGISHVYIFTREQHFVLSGFHRYCHTSVRYYFRQVVGNLLR